VLRAHGENGLALCLFALFHRVLFIAALVALVHAAIHTRCHATQANGDFFDGKRVVPTTAAVQVTFEGEIGHASNLGNFSRIRRGRNKRLDRFTLRSREKVNGQWTLYCLVHNIEKLAHAGYAA
jgi:hypothetical protein